MTGSTFLFVIYYHNLFTTYAFSEIVLVGGQKSKISPRAPTETGPALVISTVLVQFSIHPL